MSLIWFVLLQLKLIPMPSVVVGIYPVVLLKFTMYIYFRFVPWLFPIEYGGINTAFLPAPVPLLFVLFKIDILPNVSPCATPVITLNIIHSTMTHRKFLLYTFLFIKFSIRSEKLIKKTYV